MDYGLSNLNACVYQSSGCIYSSWRWRTPRCWCPQGKDASYDYLSFIECLITVHFWFWLQHRQDQKRAELEIQLKEYIDEWRKQRVKEVEDLKRLKEKQAKRKV